MYMTPAEKAAERAERKMMQKDREGLEYILSDEKGRWFLMRLFERCHLLASTFPDADHTNRMILHEGERRVALQVEQSIIDIGGLSLKQKAEEEYYDWMKSQQNLIDAAETERKE